MKRFHTSNGTHTSKAQDFYYPSAASDDKLVRRISCTVSLVGFILILLVVIFILKNAQYVLLAGALVPGNPFDECQHDDDCKNLGLSIVAIIILLVCLPLAVIQSVP